MTRARIHILQLTGLAHGGAGRHVLELCTHCDPARFAVSVAMAQDSPLLPSFRAANIDVATLPLSHQGHLWPNLKALRALSRLLGRQKVDLVHTHTSVAGALGRVAARAHGIPTLHSLHSLASHCHARGLQRWGALCAERSLDWLTVRYAAPSSAMIKQGIRNRLFSPEKVVLIPHGIDVAAVDRITGGEFPAPRQADIDDRAPLQIGFVGRLEAVKGPDLFLEASAMVVRRLPNARLVVCGSGTLEGPLQARAARLGLAERVAFLGWRGDVWRVMQRLDIVVIPSRRESFGLTATEAMALARPVVAANVEGLPEVIEDGITGVLVPPEDPRAIAEAVVMLAGDPLRRREMGRAGRRRVERFFTLERMITSYEGLYESMVPAPSALFRHLPRRRDAA